MKKQHILVHGNDNKNNVDEPKENLDMRLPMAGATIS